MASSGPGENGSGSGSGQYYNALSGVQDELRGLEMRTLELEDTLKCRSLILAELEEEVEGYEEEINKLRLDNITVNSQVEAARLKKEKVVYRVTEVRSYLGRKLARIEHLKSQKQRFLDKQVEMEAKYNILYQENYMKFLEVPIIREHENAKKLVAQLTEELEQYSMEYEKKQDELVAVRRESAENWNSFVQLCVKLAEIHIEVRKLENEIKDVDKGRRPFSVTKRAPLMELDRSFTRPSKLDFRSQLAASPWKAKASLFAARSSPSTPRFMARPVPMETVQSVTSNPSEDPILDAPMTDQSEPELPVSELSESEHLVSEHSEPTIPAQESEQPTAQESDQPMTEPEHRESQSDSQNEEMPLAISPVKESLNDSGSILTSDTPTKLMPPPPPPRPLELSSGLELGSSNPMADSSTKEMPFTCPPGSSSFFNDSDSGVFPFVLTPPGASSTPMFWDSANTGSDQGGGDNFFASMFSSSSFGSGGNLF